MLISVMLIKKEHVLNKREERSNNVGKTVVTENMIFPSIVENPENVIFTLSLFTKIMFFMQ